MHYSHERYYQRTSLINKKNVNPSLLTHPLTFPLFLITIPLSSHLRITFFRFSHKHAKTEFDLAIAQLFNILQTTSVGSLVTGLEHYWTVKKSSWGWLGGRKACHWGCTLDRSVGTQLPAIILYFLVTLKGTSCHPCIFIMANSAFTAGKHQAHGEHEVKLLKPWDEVNLFPHYVKYIK